MNFLILANDYTGTVVCNRLVSEGHKVFYVNPHHRNNGIATIANIHLALSNHIDCACICSSGFTSEATIIRNKGIPTFGGTVFQDKIDTDPEVVARLCKQCNIRILKDTTKLGMPLSTEIWFSNGQPLYQYFSYIKQYKFLAGDLGADILEGETVLFWSNKDRNVEAVKRIFEGGLFEALNTIKYSGVFSLDAYLSANDNYPYIFRIVPRLQAPVLVAMLELYEGNFGNLLFDLLQNAQTSMLLLNKIALVVSISVPPYPYNNSGFIKYLVSSADDWSIARKQIAKQIKELNIPYVQYRIDGGMQGANLSELKKMNYFNN
jgi:hypothetical protein